MRDVLRVVHGQIGDIVPCRSCTIYTIYFDETSQRPIAMSPALASGPASRCVSAILSTYYPRTLHSGEVQDGRGASVRKYRKDLRI
jgi:hypothetical protein